MINDRRLKKYVIVLINVQLFKIKVFEVMFETVTAVWFLQIFRWCYMRREQ